MKKIIILILLQTLAIFTYAQGWHISTKYFSQPQDIASERTEEVYLYKDYMKMVSGNLATVFNLVSNEIIYINTQNRTYWRGNPQRFVKEIRAEFEASIEEKLLTVEPHKQEETRAMYMEMLESSFPTSQSRPSNHNSFTVQKLKDGERISGFATAKYSVMERGFLLETIWIAPELTIAKDFDFISLSHFLNQLAQGAYADSFESSQEYFKLIERGYPVRVEIRRGDEATQISEVISAKRANLSASDFAIPQGYSSSSLGGVGIWEGHW